MIFEFESVGQSECALCGETRPLTGEHKIKSSILKAEFGDQKTVIFGKTAPKLLQSPKSKHLHFDRGICQRCNSTATQSADRAFDHLHKKLKDNLALGDQLTDQNGMPNVPNSAHILDEALRYFAKLLCCFIVEVDGPRSKSISSFALGQSNRNPVFLKIEEDTEYQNKLSVFGSNGFAHHGGLTFRFDRNKLRVKSIHSSLSISGIKYDFWVELNWNLSVELNLRYPELMEFARSTIIESES